MDDPAARRLAEEWVAAWNARDLDRVLSHYADDLEMRSLRIIDLGGEPSGVLRGKANVAAYWRTALAKISDLHFTLLDVLRGPTGIAVHYRNQKGTVAVETLELGDDGKIVRAAAYYGAPPTAA
jgi:ketosteroid isomerase-like protein